MVCANSGGFPLVEGSSSDRSPARDGHHLSECPATGTNFLLHDLSWRRSYPLWFCLSTGHGRYCVCTVSRGWGSYVAWVDLGAGMCVVKLASILSYCIAVLWCCTCRLPCLGLLCFGCLLNTCCPLACLYLWHRCTNPLPAIFYSLPTNVSLMIGTLAKAARCLSTMVARPWHTKQFQVHWELRFLRL